jgi:membrane fusion protein, multidrug efflux system
MTHVAHHQRLARKSIFESLVSTMRTYFHPTPVRLFKFRLPILLCLMAAFAVAGCNSPEPETPIEQSRPVKLAKAVTQVPMIRFEGSGRVEANKRVELSFERGDLLKEMLVKPGDEVETGTVIARVEDKNLLIDLIAARGRAHETLLQLERSTRLLERAAIAQVDVDRARSAHDVANSDLLRIEEAILNSSITAPFSGRVAAVLVDLFQMVQAKQPVVVIHDLSSLKVRINVPETFILRVGRTSSGSITARFDQFPDMQLPVTLEEYSTEAQPDTLTYPALFSLVPPPHVPILPGMSVTLEIAVPQHENTQKGAWVPPSAVFSDDANQSFVWKVNAETMRAEKVPTTVGDTRGGLIQVLEGLKEGDQVAIAGVHLIREGELLKPYASQGAL